MYGFGNKYRFSIGETLKEVLFIVCVQTRTVKCRETRKIFSQHCGGIAQARA